MAKPVFQHRHYKRIAHILYTLRLDNAEITQEVWEVVINHFARELRGTNPNFNAERFIAAAKGEPSNGRDRTS